MNVIAKFSDLFPLCAVGDIGDFDALSLQLIADAVGLGEVFGLLCLGACFEKRLDLCILLAGLGDDGELSAAGNGLLFKLFAPCVGLFDKAEAEHLVKVGDRGKFCVVVGLVFKNVIKRCDGKLGVQVVVQRRGEL